MCLRDKFYSFSCISIFDRFVSYFETPVTYLSSLQIGDETSHDSGSDFLPPIKANANDPLSLFGGEEEGATTKKMKKKKKKKHKHKDKNKEQEKSKLDFSNTHIPGVNRDLLDDRLAATTSHGQSLEGRRNDAADNVTGMMKDSDDFSDG